MSEDRALEVLLEVRSAEVPEIDADLLRKCYRIQKRHLFDKDPSSTMGLIEDAIDQAISTSMEIENDH